ncbi:MAG: GNAT family N-acetyltransferase [Chitinophagales bacterium]|nr:GNAT family N-acetyltransferase [Chitinophagaceae bacterium]MCB9065291.1 GNAT family N-acetyltransferase [Chitinophagales bacterium]
MVSILIDEDLLLRSFEPEDAPELFRAVNSSRDHLRPWFPWVDATTKPEHSLQFIQQSRVQQTNQEALALGIIYKQKIIGSMGMHNWDHYLKKAQLGYWICNDYEGQGIIHTCLQRFIDFLFEKTGLNKVEILFMSSNNRSAAVAEKMGFKVEGILRDNYILYGNYKDLVVTGLLKKEWNGLPESKGKKFKAS